jgi:hypothetical protein
MNIGYGINRRVTDFAKADIDLDRFGGLRVWVDTDEKVRPEFSSMLMALIEGDAVFVLSLADLGKGFDLAENKRKIEAHGAVVSLVDDASPPPGPRKPGPKPRWPSIPADVVKAGADKWHMPDVFTWQAAIKVFHDAGFNWVTRATLNDNIGTRSAPKSKEPKDV